MSNADRRVVVFRETAEMTINVTLAIDGDSDVVVDTGIGSFDHMLEVFARHGLFDLAIQCNGDLHTDDHYTAEDVVIVFGEVLTGALGDKHGIVRHADHKVPLDEVVASVVVDMSGRPFFEFSGDFFQPYAGRFTSHMVEHFAMSLAMNAGLTLHVGVEGDSAHHEIEALFKTLVRSLDDVTRVDLRRSDIPSTKGEL